MKLVRLLAVVLLGCASPEPEAIVNPCATPGPYVQSFTAVSGDCPSIPDTIVNVRADGALPDVGTCDLVEHVECGAHMERCVTTTSSCEVTSFTDVWFEPDGSLGSGLITTMVECEGGLGCNGTYAVVLERLDP